MVDPERLLQGGTEFERALLEGGASERPSGSLARRMAVGVGVSGTLAYSSTAHALIRTWWGKALGVVGVGAGVAGVVALSTTGNVTDADPVVAPKVVSAPAALKAQAESPQSEQTADALPQSDPEPAEEKPAAAATQVRRPRAPARATSTLAEEIHLLDQARALLGRGERARAQAVLNVYRRRYPRGVLSREAKLLRDRASQR